MSIEKLKAEIEMDPLGLGYAGMSEIEIAASLNAEARPGDKLKISRDDFINRILVWAEVEALSVAKRDTLRIMLQAENLDLEKDSKNVAYLGTLFGAASATRAAFKALKNHSISRAAELGIGSVTVEQLAEVGK